MRKHLVFNLGRRWLQQQESIAAMATICATAYKPGALPEAALRQIYERTVVPAALRSALADMGVITCALAAALCDTATDATTEVKALVPVVAVAAGDRGLMGPPCKPWLRSSSEPHGLQHGHISA